MSVYKHQKSKRWHRRYVGLWRILGRYSGRHGLNRTLGPLVEAVKVKQSQLWRSKRFVAKRETALSEMPFTAA